MKLSVIGCGYLGAVHAAAMANLGHEVVGIDVDASKIALLQTGRAPFFEPGLPEILTAGLESGRLRFSTEMADAEGSAVHFVAVGTPQSRDGYAADVISAHGSGASLAWNPEFLREGFAVKDTIEPDRLVYGVAADDATRVLDEVYATALAADTPRLVTDYATAELVKVSANAFLATKISFINAMAEIAEVTGADVTQLADAIGYDARIGRRFLNAGVGFGGGCLPKDIRAFTARAEELGRGESVAFLKEIDAINMRRRERVVQMAIEKIPGSVVGARVAVLGLTFKPDSDDVRDSPALDIAVRLNGLGADVVATDPEGIANARRLHPQLNYAESVDDALAGADLVILVTEWQEFRALDPRHVAGIVRTPRVIDGRNVLDSAAWRDAGFEYTGMGRS